MLNLVGHVTSESRRSCAAVTSSLRTYFMGPKFFSWVFRGSKVFSRGYFVGLQKFFSWVSSQFSVVDRMRKSAIEIYLKLRILFQIDLNICEFCLY